MEAAVFIVMWKSKSNDYPLFTFTVSFLATSSYSGARCSKFINFVLNDSLSVHARDEQANQAIHSTSRCIHPVGDNTRKDSSPSKPRSKSKGRPLKRSPSKSPSRKATPKASQGTEQQKVVSKTPPCSTIPFHFSRQKSKHTTSSSKATADRLQLQFQVVNNILNVQAPPLANISGLAIHLQASVVAQVLLLIDLPSALPQGLLTKYFDLAIPRTKPHSLCHFKATSIAILEKSKGPPINRTTLASVSNELLAELNFDYRNQIYQKIQPGNNQMLIDARYVVFADASLKPQKRFLKSDPLVYGLMDEILAGLLSHQFLKEGCKMIMLAAAITTAVFNIGSIYADFSNVHELIKDIDPDLLYV
uniref:Uncharacterized protein n=1 Tax=Ditylenchus dipsaci TaxID=166011 RepID=A0A915EJC7_9BILA